MKLLIRITREESGQYRATVPALPGCSASGASCEEATRNVEQAIDGYLASFDAVNPTQIESEALSV